MSVYYEVGDVIEGRFSCLIDQIRARGIVRSRIANADGGARAGFSADSIDYSPRKGYGLWGYDDEVVAARPGTDEDEQAAADVKRRVERDTDRWLGHIRDANA